RRPARGGRGAAGQRRRDVRGDDRRHDGDNRDKPRVPGTRSKGGRSARGVRQVSLGPHAVGIGELTRSLAGSNERISTFYGGAQGSGRSGPPVLEPSALRRNPRGKGTTVIGTMGGRSRRGWRAVAIDAAVVSALAAWVIGAWATHPTTTLKRAGPAHLERAMPGSDPLGAFDPVGTHGTLDCRSYLDPLLRSLHAVDIAVTLHVGWTSYESLVSIER